MKGLHSRTANQNWPSVGRDQSYTRWLYNDNVQPMATAVPPRFVGRPTNRENVYTQRFQPISEKKNVNTEDRFLSEQPQRSKIV